MSDLHKRKELWGVWWKRNQNNKINPKTDLQKKEDSEATKLKQPTKRKESEPNLQKKKKIWTDRKKEKNPEPT